MIDLPSVWGRHSEAYIDAVIVNEQALVTSVMHAPPAWEERLESLGFRRSTKAWLKMGALTPSEFQFLSPSIDLIGLRPSDVIDYSDADKTIELVPYLVQDALLRLWQRQSAAMLVALSMEHGTHYSRQEAWTFVEAALSGSMTPETETLIGLTLTKLSLEQGLPEGVMQYAASIGWERAEPQEQSAVATVLHRAGETVSWLGTDGEVQTGRLAQRLKSNDDGGWVHKEHPRWVGGYPVVAPEWIPRKLFIDASAQVTQSESDTANTSELRSHSPDLPPTIVLTKSQIEILDVVCDSFNLFPSDGWAEYMVNAKYDAAAIEAMKEFESQLAHISTHYYGALPIRFGITDVHEDQAVFVVYVEDEDQGFRLPHRVEVEQLGDGFDLAGITERLDDKVRFAQAMLVKHADDIGKAVGNGEPHIPVALLDENYAGFSRLTQRMGGLSESDLYALLAASSPSPDIILSLSRQGRVEPIDQSLRIDVILEPKFGMESMGLAASVIRAPLYGIGDVLGSATRRHADGTDFLADIKPIEPPLYRVDVNRPGENILKAGIVTTASYFLSSLSKPAVTLEMPQRAIHGTVDSAFEAFKEVMDRVTPLANAHALDRFSDAREVMASWPLRERYMRAMAKLRDVKPDDMRQYISQAITMGLKGGFEGYSEDYKRRILDRAVSMVTGRGNEQNTVEGLILIVRNRSMVFESVHFTAESLTQSREASLKGAAAEYKTRHRLRGKPVVIDLIALTDPELCGTLAGDDSVAAGVEKRSEADDADGYQDTGIVRGFAMKDIRGMGRDVLLTQSDKMNDLQKAKYLTKELIWPRKSMEEMKEAGIPVGVAACFDLFWKGIPNKPASPSKNHVRLFVELVVAMRENVEPVIKGQEHNRDSSPSSFHMFSMEMLKATQAATTDLVNLDSVYPYRSRRIRGVGLDWKSFCPTESRKLLKVVEDASWNTLIKSRKAARPAAGSRVQRDEVVRIGPDFRKGVDVSGDDFINTFMYSGVEYGNWTNQKERAKHLNFAYDSMMDFTRIMGWEPPALSLGGRLGLCIGSRGRGGRRAASAHFEPANMAVNLTRMRGDGSLAHEYFHAVACHYGRLANGNVSDVMNTVGYSLRSPGEVPDVKALASGLRDEVRESFYNLLIAIMRKPAEGSDPRQISQYTERSEMLVGSIAAESKGGELYWSTPAEMFARAMEVWVREHLAESGERNDYLVGPGKKGAVYPDEKHLERINHFVSPWLEALKTQVQSVEHPYLGTVDMPVLYSRLIADNPLGRQDLVELAQAELSQLFGQVAPKLEVGHGASWAGLYSVAANIVHLNHAKADKGTFYHEAWHACHHKLLTGAERRGLNELFSAESPVTAKVVGAMTAAGWQDQVIEEALRNPEELTAYAFQLWATNGLQLEAGDTSEFRRTKTFVDGVIDTADLFTESDALRLFERFAKGELASRSDQSLAYGMGGVSADDWDEDNMVFWAPPLEGSKGNQSGSTAITLPGMR